MGMGFKGIGGGTVMFFHLYFYFSVSVYATGDSVARLPEVLF
jgi:hypothetical protein